MSGHVCTGTCTSGHHVEPLAVVEKLRGQLVTADRRGDAAMDCLNAEREMVRLLREAMHTFITRPSPDTLAAAERVLEKTKP